MNAPIRKPLVAAEDIRVDPVEVFRLRCHSRAKLWHNGEIDLHSAVDELQHAAEASGLVKAIGQDAVQALMVEAFAPLRDDVSGNSAKSSRSYSTKAEPDVPVDDTFAAACCRADEKQRRKPADPRRDRLRQLTDDDVSLERAWHELNERTSGDVLIATLRTAEHLMQQGDAERWREWFDARSAAERAAILQHLEKGRRGK